MCVRVQAWTEWGCAGRAAAGPGLCSAEHDGLVSSPSPPAQSLGAVAKSSSNEQEAGDLGPVEWNTDSHVESPFPSRKMGVGIN